MICSRKIRLKNEAACKICLEERAGVMFLPCGHIPSCPLCAPALTRWPPELKRETVNSSKILASPPELLGQTQNNFAPIYLELSHDMCFPTMWYFEECRLRRPCTASSKLRISKCCFVSSLISHRIFKRLAKALIRLCICPVWSETLLVAHTTLLETHAVAQLIFFLICMTG